MKTEQKQVRGLMLAMGQECPDKPIMPSLEVRKLRIRLIAEELIELCAAYNVYLYIDWGKMIITQNYLSKDETNLIAAADATCDLRVVVIGTDVAMGIDGEPVWDEVHRSNASKIPDNIGMLGGKWIKGPSYSPPQLERIINEQQTKVLQPDGNHGEHSQLQQGPEAGTDRPDEGARKNIIIGKIKERMAAGCRCGQCQFNQWLLREIEKL